ncbi:hypothetical protein MKZ38_007760 [Zalerion maritima]|uniref:RAD50-interacting protein 1 n=1 Tax=Zalerion maritima TaxID=339359 RepID=A0AAD5RWB5_9PEZI|nr:hypothetical protein MKZ38_007760 [Zalerion maritima]
MAATAYLPESDIRLEDYLDDKLQSTTDLETRNLSSLLETVESQRHALQTQLDQATRVLEKARSSSEDKQSVLLARIDEFQGLQRSIDLRRAIVAESDAPDVAVQRLSGPLSQLRRVDLAKRYVQLLQDVETWRGEALQHLPDSPKDALEPYSRIKRLAGRLSELQDAADGAGVHLVGYVRGVAEMLWDEMKRTMTSEMEGMLKDRKWPNIEPETVMDDEWIACFGKMIDLQAPEILYGHFSGPGAVTVIRLLPMAVMTKVFIQEFRFHFLSDRPTSKPEALAACFRWFTSLVVKWEDFLRLNLSPLLATKFLDTAAEGKLVYVDPVSAFISCILPAMAEKVLGIADMAVLQGRAQFLSSLIADVIAFDDKIRRRFHYDGGDTEIGWAGLTSSILDKHFDTWFDAEKSFALERFDGIMSNTEARGIDYEFGPRGKTKPTHGVVRIMDLLRNVTETYRGLRKFEHKLQFLVDMQNAVLENFDDALRGSLEAYQSLTSAVGRTLHGVSKEQLAALEGIGAFESLCKVLGSAEYVVRTLEGWGMDEFFIGLWNDLQLRVSQLDTHSNPNLTPTLNYSRIKAVTSASLGTTGGDGDDTAEDSTIFDAPMAGYGNSRRKAEDLLVGALVESDRAAFKSYASKTQWTTLGDDAVDAQSLPLTADLSPALEMLKRNMEYTAKALSTSTYRRVWRQSLSKLSDLLWNQVLFHHNFTTLGAKQLTRDLAALTTLVALHIPADHFAVVREGVSLLSLPLEAAEDELNLKDAYDRIFSGNAEAREALGELGLLRLTPTNARNILQRRVEAGE